jgi:hypothetical protein
MACRSVGVFHDGGTAIVIYARDDDYKIGPGSPLRTPLAALLKDSGIDDDPARVSLSESIEMRS